MAAALTLDPTEQRLSLLSDRGQLTQQKQLIISCSDIRASRPDDVFVTPGGSPYSQDGPAAYRGDIYFTAEGHHSMDPSQHHIHSMSPAVNSSSHFNMSPGSPCDDYYRSSPYSPSYDTSSPNSISCSASPHGSPSNGHFSPYIPETSMPNLPHTTTLPPMSSCTSQVYSTVNSGELIYTNVPVSGAEYYPGAPPSMHTWGEGEGHLPSFDASFVSHGEPSHMHHPPPPPPPQMMEGEVPINIIEQPSIQMDPEMMGNINFYPDGSPMPSREMAINAGYCGHDMNGIPMQHHPDMLPGVCLLPPPLCTTQKPKPPRKPKKPKPAIQVNDEHIKDIPTSAQLWEFTLRVLKKPAYHYMVNWENRKEGLFRFHDANAFAALWGKHRNRPHMTYDKVARALRYYYKRDILNQVGGRLTYRFSKRLNKLYATDD